MNKRIYMFSCYNNKKKYIAPVGLEPTVFRLEGERVIHCATRLSDN